MTTYISPILIGQALGQSNRQAAVEAARAAANNIDMRFTAEVPVELTRINRDGDAMMTAGKPDLQVVVNGYLYVNSDDGEISLVLPDKLPDSLISSMEREYAVGFQFPPALAIAPNPKFQPTAAELTANLSVRLSEMTKTGCYLEREIRSSRFDPTNLPAWDQDEWEPDTLIIPENVERIGALVLKHIICERIVPSRIPPVRVGEMVIRPASETTETLATTYPQTAWTQILQLKDSSDEIKAVIFQRNEDPGRPDQAELVP